MVSGVPAFSSSPRTPLSTLPHSLPSDCLPSQPLSLLGTPFPPGGPYPLPQNPLFLGAPYQVPRTHSTTTGTPFTCLPPPRRPCLPDPPLPGLSPILRTPVPFTPPPSPPAPADAAAPARPAAPRWSPAVRAASAGPGLHPSQQGALVGCWGLRTLPHATPLATTAPQGPRTPTPFLERLPSCLPSTPCTAPAYFPKPQKAATPGLPRVLLSV